MKVGTDAIMLGAWAISDSPRRILDIGTGTGVIALMLAQRFPDATIDAVEIEESAASQAKENFEFSPWPARLTLHNSDIVRHVPSQTYDLIVANPPYFVNSLKSPNASRNVARHSGSLDANALLAAVDRMLQSNGTFCVIIPSDQDEAFTKMAEERGLFCKTRCRVHPTPDKSPCRSLLAFGREPLSEPAESNLTVEIERHQYSDDYRRLTQDFYLRH